MRRVAPLLEGVALPASCGVAGWFQLGAFRLADVASLPGGKALAPLRRLAWHQDPPLFRASRVSRAPARRCGAGGSAVRDSGEEGVAAFRAVTDPLGPGWNDCYAKRGCQGVLQGSQQLCLSNPRDSLNIGQVRVRPQNSETEGGRICSRRRSRLSVHKYLFPPVLGWIDPAHDKVTDKYDYAQPSLCLVL